MKKIIAILLTYLIDIEQLKAQANAYFTTSATKI